MYNQKFSLTIKKLAQVGALQSVAVKGTKYWRECAAFQRSAFGRSTAGNDVVATIFIICFLFSPPFFFLLRRDLFS